MIYIVNKDVNESHIGFFGQGTIMTLDHVRKVVDHMKNNKLPKLDGKYFTVGNRVWYEEIMNNGNIRVIFR